MQRIPRITVLELCQILNIKPIKSLLEITQISINSKEASTENACFVALVGKRLDGHNFIEEAIENGAKAIITEKPYYTKKAKVLLVKNTTEALGKIAKHLNLAKTTICVTGSVGKTTVSKIIKGILEEKYQVNATKKNYNNEIGVPLTLLSSKRNNINVVELGMRKRGEIDYLSSLCQPNISVITNAGTSHIGVLGSKEEIFLAKTEIISHTKEYAIVPAENRFKSINYGSIKPFFIGENGDCFIENYKYLDDGMEFSIIFQKKKYNGFRIKSFSVHNLYNSMYGIVIGFINSMTLEEIQRGLEKYEGENMRDEILNINGITVINDCYNASFESMKSAIFSLSKYAELKHKTPKAFIGDMLEQGEYSAELHYRIGELAKDCGIEKLFVTGKFAKYVIDGYSGGIYVKNIENSVDNIIESLNKEDVMLIKGSRALKLERIVNKMREML